MEKVKLIYNKILSWIKDNPKEAILLSLILIVGAFLRLYRISEYMTFLGDEGRDVIIARRLLVEGHPPLIGPGTSIGNMYLGPIYYYMMAPALLLANFSPVGPAVQIALLGIATIFFVWLATKEWFGPRVALVAAALYAISPTVIIYSHSSWNPNIMPFFALLSIYSVWRIWSAKDYRWLIVLGISYAFVLQSHYLGLLLLPTFGIFWLLALRNLRLIGSFAKYSLIALGIFAILMSPLVIFDARHGWNNFTAMRKFFLERQETVSIRPWNSIPKIWPIFEEIVSRLLTAKNTFIAGWLALILALGSFWAWLKEKEKRPSLYLLFSWLGFALIGLGLYKQQIYDHYYGFFFPAPFILLGIVFDYIFRKVGIINRYLISGLLLGLVVLNLMDSPIKYPPNRQLQRSQIVAQKIFDEAGGQPFNLAVLAERNYEDGYRYFLLTKGSTVLHADRWDKGTIAEELFVVCEMAKEKCDPTHSPKAEVANFGMSKIENQWEVGGVILYKLVHTI